MLLVVWAQWMFRVKKTFTVTHTCNDYNYRPKKPPLVECGLSANYGLLCKMIKEYDCNKVHRQGRPLKSRGGSDRKPPYPAKHYHKEGRSLFLIPLEVTNMVLVNSTVWYLLCMKKVEQGCPCCRWLISSPA